MDHVEVSDLGEKPSHSFSVVLAVSDGPGPAHKNTVNHSEGTRGLVTYTEQLTFRFTFQTRDELVESDLLLTNQ